MLHTVNPRLFAEQLVYIINHAEDRLLFVDAATLPIVEAIAPRLTTIEALRDDGRPRAHAGETTLPKLLCYEDLLAAETRATSTGRSSTRSSASTHLLHLGHHRQPEGRGLFAPLRDAGDHAVLGLRRAWAPGTARAETLMPMAPMFHGNAWQFPYLAPMTGSRLVLPGRNYEPDKLYELLEGERVTLTCGVPTFWLILTDWLAAHRQELQHAAPLAVVSGSAPPRSLVEKLERDYGVQLTQAWGMTEALGGSLPTHAARLRRPALRAAHRPAA